MDVLGYIGALPLAAESAGEEGGGSFLVSPGLGLMIWTLILFLFTMWVLSKLAFPKIQEALDRRGKKIPGPLATAPRQRRGTHPRVVKHPGPTRQAPQQRAPSPAHPPPPPHHRPP